MPFTNPLSRYALVLLFCALEVAAGIFSTDGSDAESSPKTTIERRTINNGMPLKIMPFGASIVFGEDSTDGNGFRLRLRDMLEANGNTVSYVGTVFHGNMTNNACEAYPGHTIQEVSNLALQSGSYAYEPNVFIVHLGTNDCLKAANETSAEAATKFESLLWTINSKDADALVVASTLIDNLEPDVEDCILDFNSRIPDVVRRASEQGQKVTLVDMHAAVPRSDINTTDFTHPNDAGYDIMARVWYEGLVNASSMISPANASGKAAPVSPPSSRSSSASSSGSSSASSAHSSARSSAGSTAVLSQAFWLFVPLAMGILNG